MTDRVDAILSMLAKTPDDVFLHYSLGMEYASVERLEAAVAEFKRCIKLAPDFLAAYTEAGKALRAAGDHKAARGMFTDGLALAEKLPDTHARDHLRQQLEALPD